MKRLLVVTLALMLVLAFAAMAQETEGGKLGYGFKAGIGFSKWTGSELDTALIAAGATKGSLFGIGGGALFEVKPAPSFAVQFEALYMLKGVKYSEGSATAKFKLSYIEIPVTLHVVPNVKGMLKPNIFAGPYVGFLASAKLKGEGGGASAEVDVKDAFKSTDFGVTFGAGFDYMVGKNAITFDARYDLGLSKIWDSLIGLEGKNTAFYFMLGYKFMQ